VATAEALGGSSPLCHCVAFTRTFLCGGFVRQRRPLNTDWTARECGHRYPADTYIQRPPRQRVLWVPWNPASGPSRSTRKTQHADRSIRRAGLQKRSNWIHSTSSRGVPWTRAAIASARFSSAGQGLIMALILVVGHRPASGTSGMGTTACYAPGPTRRAKWVETCSTILCQPCRSKGGSISWVLRPSHPSPAIPDQPAIRIPRRATGKMVVHHMGWIHERQGNLASNSTERARTLTPETLVRRTLPCLGSATSGNGVPDDGVQVS